MTYAGQKHLESTLDMARRLRTDQELIENLKVKNVSLHGYYRGMANLEKIALQTKTLKEFFGKRASIPKEGLIEIKDTERLMCSLYFIAYEGTSGYKLLASVGYFD